jgi:hypothetical protein
MLAAVDDVGHRRRQDEVLVLVQLGDVLPHRHLADVGGSDGDRHRRAEDGVGAELRLVRGAVERDHRVVELALLERVLALEQLGDRAIDGFNRLQHAFAEINLLVAVAQFARFELAGGRPRRNGGTRKETVVEQDVDFDGRVAARVEDLAADNLADLDERCFRLGSDLLGRSGLGDGDSFFGRSGLGGRSSFLCGNGFLGCCGFGSFSDSGHFGIP